MKVMLLLKFNDLISLMSAQVALNAHEMHLHGRRNLLILDLDFCFISYTSLKLHNYPTKALSFCMLLTS